MEKTELSAGLVGTGPSEERAPSKELIARLEEEISELRSRSAALDQISRGEDDLRFLQVRLRGQRSTDHKIDEAACRVLKSKCGLSPVPADVSTHLLVD